jgi:ABC-type nitrate/sulfonate/bicarbonate transport system substrate-binding protein
MTSKKATRIRIGSVPEHFMTPWHQGMENGLFSEAGLNLEWTDFPGGTGAMCQALKEDKADVCILLTEGILKAISEGNPSRIISSYIVSPIIWGIHTGVNNSLTSVEEIFDKRIAISRFGSGSELIPQVDALLREKKIKKEQFKVIQNIDGALESLGKLETDVFYWEKYTTQPYVDHGKLRRLGEFVTPWPCFMVAAREAFIEKEPEALKKMLELVFKQNRSLMSSPDSVKEIAKRRKLKEKNVERWMNSTVWADHDMVNPKMISNVQYCLEQVGSIKKHLKYDELVWKG